MSKDNRAAETGDAASGKQSAASPGRLMRHALGVANYPKSGRARWKVPYRNYYDAGDDAVAAWDALVARGFAVKRGGEAVRPFYYVTDEGRAAALEGIVYSKHHAARWGYGDPVLA